MTLLSLYLLIFILFFGYIVGAIGVVTLIVLLKKRHTRTVKSWVFVMVSAVTVLAIGLNSLYFNRLRNASNQKLQEISGQQKSQSKQALESLDFPVYSVADTSLYQQFDAYADGDLKYLKLYFVLGTLPSSQMDKRSVTMYEYSSARVNTEARNKLVNFEGSCVTGQNVCVKVADTTFGTVYSMSSYEKRRSSDKKYDYYMVEKTGTSIFFEPVNVTQAELITLINDLVAYDALKIPGTSYSQE